MRLPSGLAEERREPWSCSHCKNSTLRSVEEPEEKCMFCRGQTNYTSNKNTTATLENSAASPVTTEGLLLGAPPWPHSYATSLPSLPDTSLEDGACSTLQQQQVEDLVTGRSRDVKTPVHSKFLFLISNLETFFLNEFTVSLAVKVFEVGCQSSRFHLATTSDVE